MTALVLALALISQVSHPVPRDFFEGGVMQAGTRGGTRGGVVPWTPAFLPSLALWLDADDASTITLNGATVSQWNDKSGNGNHVSNATAATQPPYLATGWNGKPTLSFTQSGLEFLFKAGVSNFASNQDFTLAGAFEFLQTNREWDMIAGWRSAPNSSASPNEGVPILQGMFGAQQIGYHNTDKTDTRIAVAVTTRLGKKIATISRSGGANGNGGAATVTSTGFSQPTYITNTTQTWNSAAATGFQIGGRQQSATQYGNRYISEVVGCNVKLSTEDRQKLEGYLAWKWGVEADLPADHPYKSAPPTTDEPAYDPDAAVYIAAVEAADGQALEEGVKSAINDFVVGCKTDGIWDAIKSSAILAGARTLSGAVQPLAGTAPTNFNFVSGDYDRRTGLKGDGATKYLSTNRANSDDPQDDNHNAFFVTEAATTGLKFFMGSDAGGTTGSNNFLQNTDNRLYVRNRSATYNNTLVSAFILGFKGFSRDNSANYTLRDDGISSVITRTSEVPSASIIQVFDRGPTPPNSPSDARISFYSIGESLDLALLDARVSALMTAIDGAIP